MFKYTFEQEFLETFKKINQLKEPFEMLNSDPRFKIFLKMVVEIANYLNFGTSKGNSGGFLLDSFNYFDVIKSFDKSTSIINFMAEVVFKEEPKIYLFFKEMMGN